MSYILTNQNDARKIVEGLNWLLARPYFDYEHAGPIGGINQMNWCLTNRPSSGESRMVFSDAEAIENFLIKELATLNLDLLNQHYDFAFRTQQMGGPKVLKHKEAKRFTKMLNWFIGNPYELWWEARRITEGDGIVRPFWAVQLNDLTLDTAPLYTPPFIRHRADAWNMLAAWFKPVEDNPAGAIVKWTPDH